MAEQIVIYCDVCLGKEDKNVSGFVFLIEIDGKKYRIDMCDEDRVRLLEPLSQALGEYGSPSVRTVNKNLSEARKSWSAPLPVSIACLWCSAVFKHTTSVREHNTVKHGFSDSFSAFGCRCPLCGIELAVQNSRSPLSKHMKRIHPEVPNYVAAFTEAQRLGDPYGVVAERIAALPDKKKN